MISRLSRAVQVPATSVTSRVSSAAVRRAPRRTMATGGQEPIPPTSNQAQGPRGAGIKPYETAPYKQDGPPPGGFGTVKIRRDVGQGPNLPSYAFVVGSIVSLTYGLYMVGETNKETRELTKEKERSRRNLISLLQAEEDARWSRRQAELDAQEAEIMKDVPGWVVGESVYHSKKHFIQPYGSQFI